MELKNLETMSVDIAGLVDRLRVLRYEVYKAQSANVLHTMPFDMARLRTLLAWARSFKDLCVGDPILDRPATTPMKIAIADFEDFQEPANPEHRDLMRHVEYIILELVHCDSSRLGNSMLPADSARYDNYEQRLLNLLDHIEATNPIDAPEFAPNQPQTGQGRIGV